MPDDIVGSKKTAEADLLKQRRDYLRAKQQLLDAEREYARVNGGASMPGSPLIVGASLADIAAEFIKQAGHALSYSQVKAMLNYSYIEFNEGNLKRSLQQATKTEKDGKKVKRQALIRTASDLDRPIDDSDEFDIPR